MATPVTYTIGKTSAPESRDYSDFNAWAADIGTGISNDLVTADEVWTIECYEDTGSTISYSSTATVSPTTDATRNITIKAATGDAPSDNMTTSTALAPSVSNGVHFTFTGTFSVGLDIGCRDCVIQDIQIEASGNRGGIVSDNPSAGTTKFVRCIFYVSNDNSPREVVWAASTNSTSEFNDCLMITDGDDRSILQTGYDTKRITHCTFINTNSTGTTNMVDVDGNGTLLVLNTAILAQNSSRVCLNVAASPTTTGSDYNSTTDTSAIGTNTNTSLTIANEVESVVEDDGSTSDFRAKSTGALPDFATTSGNATDIIGTTRDASPTCGCWEYIAAGGGISVPNGNLTLTAGTPKQTMLQIHKVPAHGT